MCVPRQRRPVSLRRPLGMLLHRSQRWRTIAPRQVFHLLLLLLLCLGCNAVRMPNPLAARTLRPVNIFDEQTLQQHGSPVVRRLFEDAARAPSPAPSPLLAIQSSNDTNTTQHDPSTPPPHEHTSNPLLFAALVAVLIVGTASVCVALLPAYWFPCPNPFTLYFLPLVFGMGVPQNGSSTTVVVNGT